MQKPVKQQINLEGTLEEKISQMEKEIGPLSEGLLRMLRTGRVELKSALLYERDPVPRVLATEEIEDIEIP